MKDKKSTGQTTDSDYTDNGNSGQDVFDNGDVDVDSWPVDPDKPLPPKNKPLPGAGRPKGLSRKNPDKEPSRLTGYKKRYFLERLAKTGNLKGSAAHCDIALSTIYYHMNKDSIFRQRVEIARSKAVDKLEEAAVKRGVDGIDEPIFDRNGVQVATKKVYSDKLLVKLMEANDPERYRSSSPMVNPVVVNVNVGDSAKDKLASMLKISLPTGNTVDHKDDVEGL